MIFLKKRKKYGRNVSSRGSAALVVAVLDVDAVRSAGQEAMPTAKVRIENANAGSTGLHSSTRVVISMLVVRLSSSSRRQQRQRW
jgi:hypothetical protein